MIRQIIRKLISIILISSLIVGNVCAYVKVSDIKLTYIYMVDAIEDMEYKERESLYRDEHLSFLSENEENVGADSINPEKVEAIIIIAPLALS